MHGRTSTRRPRRLRSPPGPTLVDAAAAVGALDEGEGRRSVPAAVRSLDRLLLLSLGIAPGAGLDGGRVPAHPGVDLGVVDAGGEDADEQFPVSRLRPPDLAVLELVEAAVAGGDHGEHGRRPRRGLEPARLERRLPADHLVHGRHGAPFVLLAGRLGPEALRAGRPARASPASPRWGRPRRPTHAADNTRRARRGTRPRPPSCPPPCRRDAARPGSPAGGRARA